MRLAFMGSPEFAVPVLEALLAAGHEIACVYSQPARPAGRGQALKPTAVAARAHALDLAVRTPKSLKTAEAQAAFADLELDLAVVVAYGLLLPKPVLEAPRLGCLNLHASLLPRWRGAAPIQRALMAGDRETGLQAMRMEEGLDTGPILLSRTVPILADDTAGRLHDRLKALGGPLMVEAVALLEGGAARFTNQAEDGVTYARKIDPAEARIDWSRPAREIDLTVRGLSPFPGAWCLAPDGRRLKVLDSRLGLGEGAPGELLDDRLLVACGEGAVRLLTVQREGRAAMDAEAFQRGTALLSGQTLA